MGREPWDMRETEGNLAGPHLRMALSELCERRQTVFLATPYLSFLSRFLGRDEDSLTVRATMSRNVAHNALAHPGLRLRFGWGLTFFAGATRVLDYGQDENGRFLRVATPALLTQDEQRAAYRVERVGRSTGTLGGPDLTLVRFNLENASVLGLGIFCLDPVPAAGFHPGALVDVAFNLDQGPMIKGRARIRHSSGQSMGLAFHPPLDELERDRFWSWLQGRQEEDRRRWVGRAALRAQAEREAVPRPDPEGVLLVTGDLDLAAEVTTALEGAHAVRTVPPALGPMRAALDTRPPLALIVGFGGTLEESHRLRAMLEPLAGKCPLVLLGAGAPAEQGRAFAAALRATLYLERTTLLSVFFRRLIIGLIRRHWNKDD